MWPYETHITVIILAGLAIGAILFLNSLSAKRKELVKSWQILREEERRLAEEARLKELEKIKDEEFRQEKLQDKAAQKNKRNQASPKPDHADESLPQVH